MCLISPAVCVFQMPNTRSQAPNQPTLAFPRRKSCRVSSRSKTPRDAQPPAGSPSKPGPLPRNSPLSSGRSAPQPSPLSPRRPAAPPPSPCLQPRLPLSPRKRTGEQRLSDVAVSGRRFDFLPLPSSSAGDDNGCNLSPGLLGSPPKQSKPSLALPRRLGFDENSPVSPPPRLSPRRQETPSRSPARHNSERKPPVVRLFNGGKSGSFKESSASWTTPDLLTLCVLRQSPSFRA